MKKQYILMAFVVILLPFFNFFLMKVTSAPVAESTHNLLTSWFVGFGVLVIEIFIIAAPGLIPVLGEIYMSYLGRALGFPDKELDKNVDEFIGRK